MAPFRPFRRKRRPDDGRYGDKDAKAWRRLVKAARYQVRAPLADCMDLLKAADRCARAVPPAGHAVRGSVFLQLVMAARGWGRLDANARIAAAGELERLALACREALEAPQPQDPPRPPRRDIFG